MFNGFADPAFWAAIAFVGFVAVLFWKKVPEAVNKSLDQRADLIKTEIDEARKLREEAQEILADYQKKQMNADKDVQSIVDQASREAEIVAAETRSNMKAMLERQLQSAEDRITQAERQAVSEIRSVAADMSVAAAEKMLQANVADAVHGNLVDETLVDLKSKFN